MNKYYILPVLIKCQVDDLNKIKAIISQTLEKSGFFHRHDIAREINNEWIKAENSPIKHIQLAEYALLDCGQEPKQTTK